MYLNITIFYNILYYKMTGGGGAGGSNVFYPPSPQIIQLGPSQPYNNQPYNNTQQGQGPNNDGINALLNRINELEEIMKNIKGNKGNDGLSIKGDKGDPCDPEVIIKTVIDRVTPPKAEEPKAEEPLTVIPPKPETLPKYKPDIKTKDQTKKNITITPETNFCRAVLLVLKEKINLYIDEKREDITNDKYPNISHVVDLDENSTSYRSELIGDLKIDIENIVKQVFPNGSNIQEIKCDKCKYKCDYTELNKLIKELGEIKYIPSQYTENGFNTVSIQRYKMNLGVIQNKINKLINDIVVNLDTPIPAQTSAQTTPVSATASFGNKRKRSRTKKKSKVSKRSRTKKKVIKKKSKVSKRKRKIRKSKKKNLHN